ncbi:uroporphyrinogen-III C-methyltransferase [Azospira inquinata]|uniref:uroporphyrinogen-III C-methyltransferase n=1 Tax=Azospira inquinata TaxID=2785627 RepID=UPI001E2F2CFE|nr:uroporphyrinogen-III C-methyltransferase [Azospira inquinata]
MTSAPPTTPSVGQVFLVGAGPGDPELLTLKAARLLGEAEVVVYDQLVSDGVLALIAPGAQRIYAGKQAGRHALPQKEINALLVALGLAGHRVVRLKGGDPLIFGRLGEETEALDQAGIPWEIIPGITAASGVATVLGIPLTHRDQAQTLIFATGHRHDNSINLDWEGLARPDRTLAIYMGLGGLAEICQGLMDHGLPPQTPAAMVERATTPAQRQVLGTLADLPEAVRRAGLASPALLLVGEVVGGRVAPTTELPPVASDKTL